MLRAWAISFIEVLNIRRVCCFVWKGESEAKLVGMRSATLMRVIHLKCSNGLSYLPSLKFSNVDTFF